MKTRSTPAVWLYVVVACTLPLFTAGCKPPSFGNEISLQQETEIGRQEASMIESGGQVVTAPEVNIPVQTAAAKIFPLAEKLRPGVTFQIKVLQSDDGNMFSLPGGWIYIDTGLLRRIDNDPDIIGCLIAHEAAHVVLKHSIKRLEDAYGKEALVDLLTQGGYQEATDIAADLDLDKHSREEEYDADKLGLELAFRAGFDPIGMLKFFTVLQQHAPNVVNADWMLTHPITPSRIKRDEEVVRDLEAGKSGLAEESH
jgi:predicted Zn-dependent protease